MPIIYPRNDLTYAENLLYMMHAVPCEPYKVRFWRGLGFKVWS